MKQSFHYIAVLLFVVLVVCSSKLSAVRVLATQRGQKEVSLSEITTEDSLVSMEDRESMELMGVEACDGGDEECIKRRVISEAHVDYIYSQHDKP